MRTIDRCPCCEGSDFVTWPAIIAPFIADYVLRAPVDTCSLLECRNCQFRFFAQRFDDAETAELYRSYRGADYLQLLAKSPRLAMLMDFYSTACRIKFSLVPPLGFVKLHEHISFFNEQSLVALGRRAGQEVLVCQTEKIHGERMVSYLARMPEVRDNLTYARR